MYFIEYTKGKYVNKEAVQVIDVSSKIVKFHTSEAAYSVYHVSEEYTDSFLHCLGWYVWGNEETRQLVE